MRYLRSFAPWIVFAIVSAFDWRYGALSALLVAVALLLAQRRRGVGWDALILESGSSVFFAALTAIAFGAADAGIRPYTGPLSSAWLALITWTSLALRRPFTLGIARQATDPHLWNSPVFYRVNAVITAVWAACFTLGAAVHALLQHDLAHPGAATTTAQVLSFAVPVLFTIRYPVIVRSRYRDGAAA